MKRALGGGAFLPVISVAPLASVRLLFPAAPEGLTSVLQRVQAEEYEEDEDREQADCAEYAYRGQMLRVYWHPSHADPVQAPKHTDFYGQTLPSLGVRIAEFSLIQSDRGNQFESNKGGVTIDYEVLESNAVKTEDAEEEEEVSDYEDDDEAEDSLEHTKKYIQYSGKVKLIKMNVDFGVLVRAQARKVMGELDRKHSIIQEERPLTASEKEYKQLVIVASA